VPFGIFPAGIHQPAGYQINAAMAATSPLLHPLWLRRVRGYFALVNAPCRFFAACKCRGISVSLAFCLNAGQKNNSPLFTLSAPFPDGPFGKIAQVIVAQQAARAE
jgi:hypothetical protein